MTTIKRFLAAIALICVTSTAANALTPLLLYKMTEASSGTTPTTIGDTSAGTALPLTITYGTGAWTSIAAGNGLSFSSTSGAVSGALTGTKVATAMAGLTTVTWEAVVDTTNDTGFMDIAGLQATSFDDACSIVTGSGSASPPQIGLACGGGTVWFEVPHGLHHIFAVFDSTQAVSTNRMLMWEDGTAANVGTSPFAASYPALNAGADVGFTNYANNRISIGSLISAGTQSLIGPVYFVALYATAGTSTDASAHSTALLANNDADPNVAAAPPVILSPMVWSEMASAWTPPPCIVAGRRGGPIEVVDLSGPWRPAASVAESMLGCAL